MKFVALDFETANEQRNSACAIGIAIVESEHVVDSRYQLICPHEFRFSPWNIRIHGITPEHVKGDIAEDPTEENQRRDTDFQQLWSSYQIRLAVHDARTLI
jgi:DNA polymerase III epsilon subunit-like protein